MGGKQLGFSDYAATTAKTRTKMEKFLAETDQVLPWQPLLDLIQPVYLKVSSNGGRQLYPEVKSLVIIAPCVQNGYSSIKSGIQLNRSARREKSPARLINPHC